MAEYIERDATIQLLKHIGAPTYAVNAVSLVEPIHFFADVAPVVRGEWIVCGDGDNVPWMCSHCGKTTAHKYKTMYGKFCPNCGADMRGE